jgi:hypothetical protein
MLKDHGGLQGKTALGRSFERRRFRREPEVMRARERHAHGVAGHGAERVDEAGEAVDAITVGVALDRLLGPRCCREFCRNDRRTSLRSRGIEVGIVKQKLAASALFTGTNLSRCGVSPSFLLRFT